MTLFLLGWAGNGGNVPVDDAAVPVYGREFYM
jgi:hypothetical protein